MTSVPEFLIRDTSDDLAQEVAARLVSRLAGIQSAGRVPSVVLTGGTIAVKIHQAVAQLFTQLSAQPPAIGAVDWGQVEFWFGDERFVRAADPDRNVGQAAAAMLDLLPVGPGRVHPVAASDGKYGDDADAAAAGYAEELRAAVPGADAGDTPAFDILMLGIGPDGHCASLFPGHPALHEERPVVAVRNSPKPPPTRITLTMRPLRRADEVWWVAAGSEKAQAVRDAVSGADPVLVPAAGPMGRSRTLWMLDRDAAALL